MSIKKRTQNIIDHRKGLGIYEGKGRLSVIEGQYAFFNRVKQTIIEYEDFRKSVLSQINSKNGEYYKLSIEDPTFEERVKKADSSQALLCINNSLEYCNYLKQRFGRDTINISVIGRARQGKSRLLQSISGVDNSIIPADNAGDCTGAKSEICNSEGAVHAQIDFYTEQELVGHIQTYLDHLHINRNLGNSSQIPSLENDLKVVLQRNDLTAKEQSWLDHLTKFVGHYEEYSRFLGTTKDEKDPAKIRLYVAQYDINNNPTFVYLAVKQARIFTEFPYKDAGNIVLVDTIGLGDTALGIREKMLETLKNDSDAAILVRLPAATGDGIREEDNEIYDLIASKMGTDTLDKWLFYVLNVCDKLGNKKSGESMSGAIEKKKLHLAKVLKVDCGNEDSVKEDLLIPILEYLSNNLDAVDSNLMKKANVVFENSYIAYFDLCSKVGAVLSGSLIKNSKADALFDNLWKSDLQFGRRLNELESKYKKPQKCQIIYDEISKIVRNLYSSCPEKEEIQEKLESGIQGGQAQAVYVTSASTMRASLIERFEEINHNVISSLQEDIKNEIINILRSDNGGRLNHVYLSGVSTSEENITWLKAFVEEKLKDHDIVKNALQNIIDYRLNIEGLLEYRVNCALSCLDPFSDDFARVEILPSLSYEKQAELIEHSLLSTITLIGERILNNIDDILIIPYNSFYARVRKLHDRLFYLDDGIALKEVYRENKVSIWHDEFSAIVEKQLAYGSWSEINENLNALRDKRSFCINI